MAKRKIQDENIVERNITQRCGGYSFRVRITVSGVRIDETFETLEDARAFRDRKRADLAMDPTTKLVLQKREVNREALKLTLGILLNRYAAEVTVGKKGSRTELHRIRKLSRFEIALLPVQLVDRSALNRFMDDGRQEQWTECTLRKYVMLISAVFTTAVKRWDYSLENPVRLIEVPSNGASRCRRLEAGEYERLLLAMRECRNPYMETLFVLAVETAARRGELLKLGWGNVYLDKATALLMDTKNGDDRVIPLSSLAVKSLSSLPRSIDGRVFPLKDYQVRSAFELAVLRARKRYEAECQKNSVTPQPDYLMNLRFHDLRHEATTRLFEKGFDMLEAASVTGHKTLAMLKRYTHLRAEDLARKLG
ncbi:MAG: site-specific integrase [Formivibrio sp.]|nr:site-specific integrase [Formivibrio sp.]